MATGRRVITKLIPSKYF